MICITTTNSKEVLESIKDDLLKEKLAACISYFKVSSSYFWKNSLETSEEFLLIIKTLKTKKELVEGRIKELHNYECPEIIFFDAEAFPPYLKWVKESLK